MFIHLFILFFVQVAKEIADLKVDLGKTKADLTAIKDQTTVELSDMKAKHEGLVNGESIMLNQGFVNSMVVYGTSIDWSTVIQSGIA